ncbi:MAG: DnaJ domain-containing protein [Thaumarchaeota archaeon]|nr:DnaJ domain-containing protein [Nitrososphaerota archaeon]MBI3641014.1 DnaJ domain-containing protein [Nitrososphaerota archaeon]
MNSYQCYQILGVKNDASFKEIKSAYRQLVLKFHPDKNMSEDDGKRFKMVAEAYQFLKTEHKRITHKTHDSRNTSEYTGKNSNKEYDFDSHKQSWGARPNDRSPEEDWSRYTKQTENAYQDFWKYYEKTFWENYEKIRSESSKVEPEPIEQEKETLVSVDVDPSRCIACCSCETIAPSVFAVDKNVQINPKSHVINERGAKFEKILDAAQTCPTKAISVKDKESERSLYPW